MSSQSNTAQVAQIVKKLQQLPKERLEEVEDFIDFLKQRILDRQLTQFAMQTSEKTFQQVWDNPEDAEYDKL